MADANILFKGKPSCCAAFTDRISNTQWLITDQFIQKESGICCHSIDNLQLIRVKDIAFQGGCCCGCCGVITVYSSDETNPILKIRGIPGSKPVYEKLRNAVVARQQGARLQLNA